MVLGANKQVLSRKKTEAQEQNISCQESFNFERKNTQLPQEKVRVRPVHCPTFTFPKKSFQTSPVFVPFFVEIQKPATPLLPLLQE